MALVSLGNQELDIDGAWSSYTPVETTADKDRLIYVRITNVNSDKILGSVLIRYAYTTSEGNSVVSPVMAELYAPNDLIAVPYQGSKLPDKDEDFTFQARRVTFYKVPSQLSRCTVEILIEPQETS